MKLGKNVLALVLALALALAAVGSASAAATDVGVAPIKGGITPLNITWD